jgi:DNA-binding beta-propeller fold protein YncE
MIRYLIQPKPLPEMVPIVEVASYPPTYKFAITGVDGPLGVAVSPDGERIYVTEGKGLRFIKVFDRNGKFITSFSPPGTTERNRTPTYLAVEPTTGRVFVVDTYNNSIDIFDADGKFIDSIIGQDMTLSKFVTGKIAGNIPDQTRLFFDGSANVVHYQVPGQDAQMVPGPGSSDWAPLGIRFDREANLLFTDVTADKHRVRIIPAAALAGSLSTFAPQVAEFGVQGSENGQLLFPNSVVRDSLGNFYVSDGNNGRISKWTPDLQYNNFFGLGAVSSGLNLPRGAWMDGKDRLHVADAVGQIIRVYDVSGDEPVFLYSFGEFGITEGLFNYPNDICIDETGRLYIADRENNRISVWSY